MANWFPVKLQRSNRLLFRSTIPDSTFPLFQLASFESQMFPEDSLPDESIDRYSKNLFDSSPRESRPVSNRQGMHRITIITRDSSKPKTIFGQPATISIRRPFYTLPPFPSFFFLFFFPPPSFLFVPFLRRDFFPCVARRVTRDRSLFQSERC